MSILTHRCRYGLVHAPYEPVPDTQVVVVTINGKVAQVCSVADFESVVQRAIGFAHQPRHDWLNIAVTCRHVRDQLYAMGLASAEFIQGMSPEVERELRALAIATCKAALLECDNRHTRAEAYAALEQIGVF